MKNTSDELKALYAEQSAINPRMITLTTKSSLTNAEYSELQALRDRDDEIASAISAARRPR